MLWEIESTPHRLLGSMHQLPANTVLPDWFAASYDGIQRFVFESDVDAKVDKEFGIDFTQKHLKSYVALEIYQRAMRLLKKIGVDNLENFEALVPWKASAFFQAHYIKSYGYLTENGVDHRLQLLADEKKLLVDFFESRTHSSELRENSCKKFGGGLAYFRSVIKETESGEGKSNLEQVFQDWMSSNLEALRAVQEKELAEFPYLASVQLQRNREWVYVAKKLLQESTPTLLVVGAFHTVGKGSFIKNMESEGFKFNFIS